MNLIYRNKRFISFFIMSGTGLKNAFTYLGNNAGLEIEEFQNLGMGSGENRASRNTNASL